LLIFKETIELFNKRNTIHLPQLLALNKDNLARTMEGILSKSQLNEFWKVYDVLPIVNVNLSLSESGNDNKNGICHTNAHTRAQTNTSLSLSPLCDLQFHF
jgi:hypothetical protein